MSKLRDYRKRHGMTQAKLAEKVHISADSVYKIESGYIKPHILLADAIAAYFGVRREELFPDGVREKYDHRYGAEKNAVEPYVPPEEPPLRPVRHYPPGDLTVKCWHCRRTVTMRADDVAPPNFDGDPGCPHCGAVFYDIIPLMEAANV